MRRHRPHPVLHWLVLIGFVFSNAIAGGMVVCRDGEGGSRVEWGCVRSDVGQCLTGCGEIDGEDQAPPQPCQDTPLVAHEQYAKTAQPTTGPTTGIEAPAVVPAVLVEWPLRFEPVSAVAPRPAPLRPPDTIGRLRTIVLIL